jgi:cell division protease FtsH
MLLTDEEKKVTAYHEAGHALVSVLRDHTDPIHKVTIIPRGMALGVTVYLPGDRHNYTREYLETRLATAYGGRVAEEIFLSRCPPEPAATSRTPPISPAAWFASTV